MSTQRITVTADHPYDVVVGHDVLDEVVTSLPDDATRVAVLRSPHVRHIAVVVVDRIAATGRQVEVLDLPDGETAKTVEVAQFCWSALADAGFTRTDVVVAVGGGATTDLAGFVAATWLRGVRMIHVPTTVLAMVDAAVGGKTGVNIAHGKNLVGSFHSPVGVVCDTATLKSLPPPELRSGLAEVAKCGFIADPQILSLLEQHRGNVQDPGSSVLAELIARSVEVKAAVVGEDFREAGLREVLNYGHTLGHAIEQVEHYRWRHGEAISVGMMFAAHLSVLAGRLAPGVAARHRDVLKSLGLPTTYRRDAWPALLAAMRLDKKSRGAALRFVVLDDIKRPGRLEAPDEQLLEQAFAEVSQ